jgi:hypothetical protein
VPARLLALVAAAAMVVGAVVVRSRLDDGGGGNSSSTPASSRMVCGSDLDEDVCGPRAEIKPEDETAGALIAAPDRSAADLGTWLTIGPWPQMVDVGRRAANKPRLFTDTRPAASIELVAVVLRKPAQCTAEVTWRCLGDGLVAGAKVGAPARGTGLRLLATAAFAGAYLGRADYASNDVTDDPAATDWLASVDRGIERARAFGATSLADFLAQRVAADVFVTTMADARTAGAPASQIVTPTPLVRVTSYLAATGRFDAGDLADRFQLLQWQVPPRPLVGLPSPGVLLALRDLTG